MNVVPWNLDSLETISDYFFEGKIVAVPSETLYGVFALANDKKAVEKVYKIKGRNPVKPVIILIGKISDLKEFGIEMSVWQKEQTEKYWPGAVSIILPCDQEKYKYLHRGTKTLAFRLPNDELLMKLLKITGPLVAPSANPEGMEPGITVEMVMEYFGEKVDLYVDGGIRNSPPSTLISIIDDKIEVLRGVLKENTSRSGGIEN